MLSRTVVHAGKTLEIRRSEAGGDKGKGSTAQDLERLFLLAEEDRYRPRIGLSPLPMPVPPPPPPSEYVLASPQIHGCTQNLQAIDVLEQSSLTDRRLCPPGLCYQTRT